MTSLKMTKWFLLCTLIGIANGEVFTAMTDMSRLLATEGELIRTVENYIVAHEKRLEKLKRDLNEMDRVHGLAAQSPDAFLGNPINAYLLVKRLTVDWADLQTVLVGDQVGQVMLNNLTSMTELLRWPDEEDLSGAATAVMRLQDTYKLETSQLAKGLILDMTAYRELTAADCFEVGRQAYNGGDHVHTMPWMQEALKRSEMEEEKTVSRSDILEYLAFSTYMQGHVKQALKLTNELLELKPNHQRALGNKIYYEEALLNQNDKTMGDEDDMNDMKTSVDNGYTVAENTEYMDSYQRERYNYERLCRGEGKISTDMHRKLVCYFQHGPGKALVISPVKSEVVHIHPTIIIYHDVLSDREIEKIKELATPRFKRATVQNYKTGELETASYRISKSAWLKTDESKQIYDVNARIGQVTGLNMDTAEELQVANYGLGGHYEPHYDFARREEKDAFKSLGTGNRIATFLFYDMATNPEFGVGPSGDRIATWLYYMSDVEAGGATVFPHLELSLWPKKGAAAFWHNLHPHGEGDDLTRHAACPVLVGTKWVSNKWIHERGQERTRPCGTSINDLVKLPYEYVE